jgi:hypothetical protein
MSDVFYLRPITPPITPAIAQEMSTHAGGCFTLHRVDWLRSFLSSDGARMLCWYRAPDTESVRIAMRQLGADVRKVFPGTVSTLLDDAAAKDDSVPRIAAEYEFDAPANGSGHAIARSLAARGLHPEWVFASTDGLRAIVVLRDRDEPGTRALLQESAPAPRAAWGCSAVTPTA